jgi:TIR domain
MRIRPLFSDDIFISYARRDSTTYADGLGDELTKQGFACFSDTLGTEANRTLPPSLRRTIRSCGTLVVIATKWSGTRDAIGDEIDEFLKSGPGRSADIVPIDIDGSLRDANWYPRIEGIAPAVETNQKALDDGNPSPGVVSRIVKSFRYRRRSERLRRWTRGIAIVLFTLIATSVVAAFVARRQLARARVATTVADRQEAIAAARSLATSADILRQQSVRSTSTWAAKLQTSTLLSIEAHARLAKLGIEPADASQSLRSSLDLLPRVVRQFQHDHLIREALLTADAKYVLTQDDGGVLRIWNSETNQKISETNVGSEDS